MITHLRYRLACWLWPNWTQIEIDSQHWRAHQRRVGLGLLRCEETYAWDGTLEDAEGKLVESRRGQEVGEIRLDPETGGV